MQKFKIQKRFLFSVGTVLKASLLGCLVGAIFFSCSKNDYNSYCPTWRGFTYYTGSYPNYVQGKAGTVKLNAGDSIHVTAVQDQHGHLINGTYYSWVICYDTLDNNRTDDPNDDVVVHVRKTYSQHTNYDGYVDGADDPTCHMLLPSNALSTTTKPDTIMFVARYMYSGQGVTIETGNIVENTSYHGRITPQSGPTAGGASGNFYFYVN